MTRTEQAVAAVVLAVVVGGISDWLQNWWTFAGAVGGSLTTLWWLWRTRHADRLRVTPTGDRDTGVRGEPRD